MNENKLETVEINPQLPVTASVIWLHGLGADGYDFADIIPALRLPKDMAVRFIFPHAPIIPITLNAGHKMRAWFDIIALSFNTPQDEPGIRKASRYIEQLIDQEQERGIAAKNIILAGFSQGGAMALHCGLRYPKQLAGILVLSGFLVLKDTLQREANPNNSTTPILIIHGEYDSIVPIDWAKFSKNTLEQQNYRVKWLTFPMDHEVCKEEIHEISSWLQNILGDCCN